MVGFESILSNSKFRLPIKPREIRDMKTNDEIRDQVWAVIEQTGAAYTKTVHDRIPHFKGAEAASLRIFELGIWRNSRVIKGNPDQPQRPLRQRALEEGKILYMAVPRLQKEQCFVELDPSVMASSPVEASTISGAFQHGRLVNLAEMHQVDLVISGSVAVNRSGIRIGKGGGFADLESGLAVAAGIVQHDTPIVGTVHQLQVLDQELPWTQHDACLDYFATPDELVKCSPTKPRPTGIYWEDLSPAKIKQIPALKKLRKLL